MLKADCDKLGGVCSSQGELFGGTVSGEAIRLYASFAWLHGVFITIHIDVNTWVSKP
jgi:hypothetical protein